MIFEVGKTYQHNSGKRMTLNDLRKVNNMPVIEQHRTEEKDIMRNVINMIWNIAKISPEYGNALMDVLGDDIYEKIGKLANEE